MAVTPPSPSLASLLRRKRERPKISLGMCISCNLQKNVRMPLCQYTSRFCVLRPYQIRRIVSNINTRYVSCHSRNIDHKTYIYRFRSLLVESLKISFELNPGMKSDPYHQEQSGTSTTKCRAVSAAHIPYGSQHSTTQSCLQHVRFHGNVSHRSMEFPVQRHASSD